MASFADSWAHQELLNISKRHRDAMDHNRVRADAVIGVDNWCNLMVSTVFAAISIERALNDYILIHCVFVATPYLQEVVGDITAYYLRAPIHKKINLLRDHWPDELPLTLLKDVNELFRIRNLITHQTGMFQAASNTNEGYAVMHDQALTNADMQHALRHYEIARDLLSRFWLPGSRELNRGQVDVLENE